MATAGLEELRVLGAERSTCGCGKRGHLNLLPAVAVLVLPKCPVCVAGWISLFGLAGTDAWLTGVWGVPIFAGLLLIGLLGMGWRVWRGAAPALLWAGVPGAAAVLTGKQLGHAWLSCAGLMVMVVASLWGHWRRAPICLSRRPG